jgi:hypothetical protein
MFYNPNRETEGCEPCKSSGVFVGPGEPKWIGNVCHCCDGTGQVPAGSKYSDGKPFSGRQTRPDVKFVRRVVLTDGATTISKLITYDQFLKGMSPKE